MEELEQQEIAEERLDRIDYRTRAIHERLDIIEKHIKFIEAAMATKDQLERRERSPHMN